MTDPLLVDAVAWALFAGEDATYLDGTHVPDEAERELAALFVESLAMRGYTIVKQNEDRIPYVGTGRDGCLRSAQIDEEEIGTLPTGPHQPGWSGATEERRAELLASAARWREQANRSE